jgi:hypothetical protein
VAFNNGVNWEELASGTTLPIQDIWGAYDPSTRQLVTLAIASNVLELPPGKRLMFISGTTVAALPDSGLPTSVNGVWFPPGGPYYVVGAGMFKNTHPFSGAPWVLMDSSLTAYYMEAIRGNGPNDIMAVGAYGAIVHYNGVNWCSYDDQTHLVYGTLHSVAMHGNLTIAVGEDATTGKAVALIGRR